MNALDHLTEIFDLLDYHIAAYDREWRYTYVNTAATRMLARPRESLIGQSIWELFPEAIGNQYYFELHEVAATGRPIRSDHYYPPFDQWFENHIYPLSDGVVVLSREVTAEREAAASLGRAREALQQAQERLQLALDAAQMVAWDHHVATGRTTLSSSALHVLGTTDGRFLWPEPNGAGGDDPQIQARARAVADARQQGGPWRAEFPFRRPDSGQTIWLEDRGHVKLDTDGAPVTASGVLMNITERVELERQLTDHVRELAEANRLKDEFLATLSHELRTPLNVIRGRMRMLPAMGRPEDAARVVEIIDRNSVVIERIVGDLLDVARSTRGQLRLECHQVAFAQVAQAAVLAVQPAADAKQITLTSDLADGLPMLWADGARLQQVLWNLLNNAVKFTPPHGRVDLVVDHDADGILVSVSDTGIGIAPELLPRIFDPFWQAEGGTARRFGGLGLGLSIARTLVELHGGQVEVESGGASRGARFTIRLPLGSASAAGAATVGVPGGR